MTESNFKYDFADYERQQQEQRDKAAEGLKGLCDPLAALGVASVVGKYDGYGDSGNFESVEAFAEPADRDDDFRGGDEIKLSPELTEQLKTHLFDFLPAGFEINEGSFGDLVLDVAERKVYLEHNQRVESSEYSEQSFDLEGE